MVKQNQYFPQSVPHPGIDLAEKIEELGMGPKEFAVRAGKPEKTITAILKGESSITPDMAVQFENVLRIPANFWMNRQRSYDEYEAREKRKVVLKESVSWAKLFPIADMIKKQWLPNVNPIEEKTAALLAYFGISSHTAWENYYFKQQLKVAFRISLAQTKEPHAISAWLRKGELQAAELKANSYDEKLFKDSLADLKNIMVKQPDDFFKKIQNICLQVGVKVVHTPCLPKAPISASTRWLNDDVPLIQLSGRYNRNDIFWFSFFHESGHIILHGKKDIFLESIDYSDKDLDKEKEADAFAVKWTLTEEQEEEILQCFKIDEDIVTSYAKQFNTHPAIIIGRLHHKKLISPSTGRNLIIPVIFND